MSKSIIGMSFRDAVLREHAIDRIDTDVITTSGMIPTWMQVSIEILSIEEGISESKLYIALINHGTIILQRKLGDYIKDQRSMRRNILRSNNEFAKSFLTSFKMSPDNGKSGKRTLRMLEWCQSYLGQASKAMQLSLSSMVVLAVCYSLNTWEAADETGKQRCADEISFYEERIMECTCFCASVVGDLE